MVEERKHVRRNKEMRKGNGICNRQIQSLRVKKWEPSNSITTDSLKETIFQSNEEWRSHTNLKVSIKLWQKPEKFQMFFNSSTKCAPSFNCRIVHLAIRDRLVLLLLDVSSLHTRRVKSCPISTISGKETLNTWSTNRSNQPLCSGKETLNTWSTNRTKQPHSVLVSTKKKKKITRTFNESRISSYYHNKPCHPLK